MIVNLLPPTIDDETKLFRVLRYINSTINFGIKFKKCELILNAMADASHLSHDNGRGQSGVVVKLGSNIIDIISKRQSLVTQSSSECELVALNTGLNMVEWAKNLLNEIGINQNNVVIYQDNISTI